MKYAIEYDKQKVFFDGKQLYTFNTFITRLKEIDASKTIMLCGWCDKNHHLTKRLKELGYETSHGICEQCSEKEFGYKPKE